MYRKFLFVILIIALAIPLVAGAQTTDQPRQIFRPEKEFHQPTGFLDALVNNSRFSMSHSYSLSVFSLGNQTLNQGLYLNTLKYRISDPLFMQVSVGYLHQPLGGVGLNPGVNGKLFLQRAMLQYKPSDTMTLTIDYQQVPNPFHSRYSPYSTYSRW